MVLAELAMPYRRYTANCSKNLMSEHRNLHSRAVRLRQFFKAGDALEAGQYFVMLQNADIE